MYERLTETAEWPYWKLTDSASDKFTYGAESRKLAYSAQMYHYEQQKRRIIETEKYVLTWTDVYLLRNTENYRDVPSQRSLVQPHFRDGRSSPPFWGQFPVLPFHGIPFSSLPPFSYSLLHLSAKKWSPSPATMIWNRRQLRPRGSGQSSSRKALWYILK